MVSVITLALMVLAAVAGARAQRSPSDSFEALVQRYIDQRRDSGNLARAAIEARLAAQKELLREVRAIAPGGLSAEQRIDHATIVGQLEGSIFELDVLRPWEKDPELYLQYGSLAGLMDQPGDATDEGAAPWRHA